MAITNVERFKTTKERTTAFKKACNGNCVDCKIFKAKNCQHILNCTFVWLEMEADEEKPLPCPFCGSEIEVQKIVNEDLEDLYKIECSDPDCMCGTSSRYFSNKIDAIAAWNKRVDS